MAEHSSTVSQNWLAEAVVAGSPEAIVVTDQDGVIRLWNEGATRMFGFSASEALGVSLDLIIPEKLRDRHWKGYRHSMATGTTKYGDTMLSVPATHQDGRRLSIEFSVALLRDEAGAIVGISAIMREVSERRAKEKALRTKISDLENSEKALRARVVELTDRGAQRPTMSAHGLHEQAYAASSFDT